MLNREELREMAAMEGDGSYFVSLYLNVNPLTNPRGEYSIWFKNALKDKAQTLEKAAAKKAERDLKAAEAYVLGNRRDFKKGLVLLSSQDNGFWREYNLSVSVKNELVVEKSPYIKPLLHLLDNYRRYAVLLVEKETARIFIIHLGEMVEYGEVQSSDVPGRHKRGGWFALSQNHFARHIDFHIGLHLKEVVRRLEGFLKGEVISRVLIGGSEDAVAMVKGLLPRAVAEKIIGVFSAGMYENSAEILKKTEAALGAYEKKKEAAAVAELITRAMKNDRAVTGIADVVGALGEGRVMKLVMLGDFGCAGYQCTNCRAIAVQAVESCPYCGGVMDGINYLVELAAQKAVEQDAIVEVVSESEELKKAGSIGAFLRF